MRKLFITAVSVFLFTTVWSQVPCARPAYRQFDFWIGEWEAFGTNGKKAGDSKISTILDSCIILEEWTSANLTQGLRYAGKSFNTYNAATKQWQQTWVDNVGGTTEYLKGTFEKDRIVFLTNPVRFHKDSLAIKRLTFFNLGPDKVRQFSEISKDDGKSWSPEYDLEYRRKNGK